MPQCVSEMVQVSNFYLQRGAAKILNKALLKFGRKPMMAVCSKVSQWLEMFCHESEIIFIMGLNPGHVKLGDE